MPKNSKSFVDDVKELANEISESTDSDVLFISADIERGLDTALIKALKSRQLRKNVILLLVTPGGDADVAYRIARFLQDSYQKFTAFVAGSCKSAGTLCVLGANEIVMCDMGELGPLDVQLYKKDELWELSSGLIAFQALQVLQDNAFNMFEEYFLAIKTNSGGQITFKTATELAMKMSVGLLEPLYRQIDPLHVGEIERSMKIATAYGKRLMVRSKNFNQKTLETLSKSYPSHGFVIDKAEVETLFNNVRPPTATEDKLRTALGFIINVRSKDAILEFLSDEPKETKSENTSASKPEASIQKTKPRANTVGNTKDSR